MAGDERPVVGARRADDSVAESGAWRALTELVPDTGKDDDCAVVFAEIDGCMPVYAAPGPGDEMSDKPIRIEAHDVRRAVQPADAELAASSDAWATVRQWWAGSRLDVRELRQVMRSRPMLRRLVEANAVAVTGNCAMSYALQTLALLLTGSAVVAGTVRAAATAPNLIFAPLAGIAADTFDRRKIILAGQAIGMAATTAMSVLTFVVGLPVWLPLGLNFASCAPFLATVSRWYKHIPPGKQNKPQTVREAMRGLQDGWSRVLRKPLLRAEVLTGVLANAAFAVLALRALTVVLTAPWWVAGAVAAASGLGGVVGALGLSTLLKRSTVKVVYQLATVGLAVFAVVQAATAAPLWIALGTFGVSLCGSAKNVAVSTYQFELSPRPLIGRIRGAMGTVTQAGMFLGSVASGFLLSALGIGISGWVAAVAVAVATVVGNLVLLDRRNRIPFRRFRISEPRGRLEEWGRLVSLPSRRQRSVR